MLARLAADATLVLHLAFIVFALLGALLALRWPWVPLLQVPAAAWGAYVELTGKLCPLTHVENHFRRLAGAGGYEGGFVQEYLLPIIYPSGLTRDVQLVLAAVVIGFNVAIYGFVAWRHNRRHRAARVRTP